MASITELNAEFTFYLPRRQLFAFPSDVISSMLENPSSSKGLAKLYQTCKYFYGKRPILIADDVLIRNLDGRTNSVYINEKDVTNLQNQIWLTDTVYFDYVQTSFPIPKFFRYSIKKLYGHKSCLPFDDFILFTSEQNVTHFEFIRRSDIFRESGGKFISFADVLSFLPNVQSLWYSPEKGFSRKLLKRLVNLEFNHKFTKLKFEIDDIPRSFDINLLCAFIEKNCDEKTNVEIIFCQFYEKNNTGPLQNGYKKEMQKMKLALKRLDSKWKLKAHPELKKVFRKVDIDWARNIK